MSAPWEPGCDARCTVALALRPGSGVDVNGTEGNARLRQDRTRKRHRAASLSGPCSESALRCPGDREIRRADVPTRG